VILIVEFAGLTIASALILPFSPFIGANVGFAAARNNEMIHGRRPLERIELPHGSVTNEPSLNAMPEVFVMEQCACEEEVL
jgi:hypothetical protein